MLTGSYNYALVVLSVLIAMVASYVALDLAARTTAASGAVRRLWLLGGAFGMGLGIWSMHYIGMLALVLPVQVGYDLPTVLLSLLAAVLASAIALIAISRKRLTPFDAIGGSLAMGGGIATMHYVGMAAMRMPASCEWDLRIVALSVIIAVVVSYVALWLSFLQRTETRAVTWLKLASAAVMGLAIAGMHYTGMAAVHFASTPMSEDMAHAVNVSLLGVAGIAVVTLTVLGLTVLTSVLHQRLVAQAFVLRASEERYRLLFDRSLAGVYQSTLDGRLLDCNDAFAKILGYASREACLQRDVYHLYLDAQERDAFVERLQEQRNLPNFECCLARLDGSPVWVLESATLIDGVRGQPAIIEGTLVDITRRKEIESQMAAMAAGLQVSVNRYKVLVESTKVVPWEMEVTSGVLTYVSPNAADLYDCAPDDLVGRVAMLDLVHPDDRDRIAADLSRLASQPAIKDLELDYRVVTMGTRVVNVHSLVGIDQDVETGRRLFRGMSFDVTNQTRLEAERRQAQRLESVGRLASGVAHEINTPVQFVSDSVHFLRGAMEDLTALIAIYKSLLAGETQDAAAQRAVVAHAEEEVDLPYLLDNVPKALDRSLDGLERVATIVRSMKEFAYIDHKHMRLVDLNHAVENTLVIARNEYRYVADVETDLGDIPRVMCHGGDINQVILNIVINAGHAIADVVKGTDRRGLIVVRTRRQDDAVVISIRDTGGGIPDGIRDRIFDPFFTTKAVGKGTGQGLAIARAVLEKHGGDLTLETELGEGTTFFVRLPIDGSREPGVAA